MAAKTTKKAEEVKTIANLHEELAKLRLEQLELRKSHKQGELVNPHVLTVIRKNIARTMTAIQLTSASDLLIKEEEK